MLVKGKTGYMDCGFVLLMIAVCRTPRLQRSLCTPLGGRQASSDQVQEFISGQGLENSRWPWGNLWPNSGFEEISGSIIHLSGSLIHFISLAPQIHQLYHRPLLRIFGSTFGEVSKCHLYWSAAEPMSTANLGTVCLYISLDIWLNMGGPGPWDQVGISLH